MTYHPTLVTFTCTGCGIRTARSTVYVRQSESLRRPLICEPCTFKARNERERIARRRKGVPVRPRPEQKSRHCLICEGQPWRREAPNCLRCGQPYAPERPVTLADVMAMPRPSRRPEP